MQPIKIKVKLTGAYYPEQFRGQALEVEVHSIKLPDHTTWHVGGGYEAELIGPAGPYIPNEVGGPSLIGMIGAMPTRLEVTF